MTANGVIRALTLVVFVAIAAISWRHWRRQGSGPARWIFIAFSLLSALTLTFAVVPDEADGDVADWTRKLAIAGLALFPYCLLRFVDALEPASQRVVHRLAAGLTGLVVLATLAVPPERLGGEGDTPTWYLLTLLVQWVAISALVAVRLWRAGHGQPTVARRRMRTLSLASLGLALALVLAGAAPDDTADLVIRGIALGSGVLFVVAFAPPFWVRVIWRRPEEERLRAAVAELMGASDRADVTETLLPHVARLVGGRGAALLDGAGEVVGSYPPEGSGLGGAAGRDLPAAGVEPQVVDLGLPSGRLLVSTGPYTPFFGREELELLRSLGALAELALQRSELFDRERKARLALERQTRFSQRLIDSSVDGILAFDRDVRYTVWNPGMERITGMRAAEVLGRHAFDAFPFLREIGEHRFFEDALAGRERVSTDRPYVIPDTGREGWFEGRYSPLYGEGGEIIGGLSIVREVTERRRAEQQREQLLVEQGARAEAEAGAERMRQLQSLTDAALGHVGLDDLIDELVERTRRILQADTAVVLLLDPETATLVPHGAKGMGDEGALGERIPVGEGFAGRVAAERRPVALEAVAPGDLVSPALRERGVQSLLGAPLLLGGHLMGVLHVGTDEQRTFPPEQRTLLQLIADRVALAIEHNRLYQREHGIAETLQRSLLPERLPAVPGVAVAARYLPGGPGTIGGDWYDVIPLADGRVGLAMGDVAGHGIGAASLMGQLRSGLRAYALDGEPPAGVLRRLDRLIESLDGEGMATLVYVVFDPRASTVCAASAGHPPPLVLGPTGEVTYIDKVRAAPLGTAIPEAAYPEEPVALGRGSTLLLYTDGLVERRDVALDERLAQLRRVAADAPPGLEALCDHILASLLPEGAQADDAALLAVHGEDGAGTRG